MKLLSVILMLPALAFGQINLVPNGSFEELDSCPNGISCSGLLELALGWYEPTLCTSDLYHQCANGGCSVPTVESVSPFEGSGMAHIGLFSGFGQEKREYVAIRLVEPLQMDSLYLFSIRLHKSGGVNSAAVGSFGVYFASDSTTDYSINHGRIDVIPQLQRSPDSIMSNTNEWYYWVDTLRAIGYEEFILLGNFLPDAQTPYLQPSFNNSSTYYIDDVRLTKISKPNLVNEVDVGFVLYPNPSANMVNINYKGNLNPVVTRLFTIDGRGVFSAPWQKSFDVSGLSEGLYLLQVEFDNGAVGTQRLVVQR